jgi:hypothetical protein
MSAKDAAAARARSAVRTVRHSVTYVRHLLRGNRFSGDVSWVRKGSPPLVLTHGFLGTRGTMVPLSRRFQRDGRVVFSYHHGAFQLRSLRRSAEELVIQMRELDRSLDLGRLDVVGFSMGGLIALHAVKFLQAQRWIRRLALLATPVEGTWVGLAGVATIGLMSSSVWQCLPGSTFLRELREAPLPPDVRVRQIHAAEDAFCPIAGPIEGVDRERDYIVLPGGHSSLCVSPRFYVKLREFFDGPDTQPRLQESVDTTGDQR